jgi:hypothetical protein
MPGATAEPPAAPPVAAPPAATPPPTRTTIENVLPSTTPPPAPGRAHDRMRAEVNKKWNADDDPAAVPAKVPDAVKPPKPADTPKPAADDTPAEPAARPGDEPPADLDPKDKKQNPWKLLKAERARLSALERQIAEAKTTGLAESEKAQYLERIEKTEAKLKTYEDEIRFKAYEKSDEFQTKFETPYNQAWQKHMDDLRGVTIMGEDGVARPMEAKDILDLVNLELADARDLADAKWGKFAGDAMTARKEIRDLFHARSKALEEARKTGADREKQMTERQQKWHKDATTLIKTTWDTENHRALNDPNNGEYFKPAEGDDTRNQLLGKGFALVDKAFAENPMDPRHTPEQRAEIVRRHAAVRNRAAAFGPMKYIIAKLREKLAALEKANGQYKGSEPPAAGGTDRNAPATPTSARARLEAVRREKWGG